MKTPLKNFIDKKKEKSSIFLDKVKEIQDPEKKDQNIAIKVMQEFSNFKDDTITVIDNELEKVSDTLGKVEETRVTVDNKIEEVSNFINEKEEDLNTVLVTVQELSESVSEATEVVNNLTENFPSEENLVNKVLSQIPRVDEKKLRKDIIESLPNKASLKIIQEKFETDPMSVIDKIMAMPEGKFKLKTKNIDGLDQTISAFNSQLGRGYLHGGGISTVSHDATLSGNGTPESPLVVVTTSSGVNSINTDSTTNQFLVVGTSGTDFAIVDNGTGTHTFNLPTASAVNRGALSSADWTTFNNKLTNSISTARLWGRTTAGTGVIEEISIGSGLSMAAGVLTATGTVGPGTINEIAYFDTTTSIASLTVATYPSLTEISFVKGVTSAIQTQLNARALTATTITIAGTANQITSSAGAQDLSANRTWTLSFPSDVIIPTVLTVPNTGLHILDTNATHDLIIVPGSNLTADRTLTLTTGDTDMIVNLTATTDEYVLAYDTGTNTWRGVVMSAGMTNPMTTTGDIIYGSTTGSPSTPARLAIGALGTALTVNTSGTGLTYVNMLRSTSAQASVDYNNRILYDNNEYVCISWQARTLQYGVGGTNALDWSTGNIAITNTVSSYNGVTTSGRGIPSLVGTPVNLTGQSAAIGSTTLYTVPNTSAAQGMYRVSFHAKVTTPAGTSSVLGGAAGGGFKLTYTDADDSVVVTTGAVTNTSGSTLSGNTDQTVYSGFAIVKCLKNTNIVYTFGYQSTAGAGVDMQYSLSIRVEPI